jgi:hypothetical protein
MTATSRRSRSWDAGPGGSVLDRRIALICAIMALNGSASGDSREGAAIADTSRRKGLSKRYCLSNAANELWTDLLVAIPSAWGVSNEGLRTIDGFEGRFLADNLRRIVHSELYPDTFDFR